MSDCEKITVLNLPVMSIDVETLLRTFTKGCLFTPNIDHFVLLQSDETFYRAYMNAEYVVMDSQVVFLLYKMMGRPFKAKIAGSDFFPRFCHFHRTNESVRIFLLGGIGDVAGIVRDRINREAGRTMVVGTYSPSLGFEHRPEESEKIVRMIEASGATTLAVGLGTPKQEKWIYQHAKELHTLTMMMGIGATLDFLAGKQRRAPVWMQNAGLEWLYRLLHDPVRLFKRYLLRDVHFFYYLLKDVMKTYTNPFDKPEAKE